MTTVQTEPTTFEDVLPTFLEAFRDFVRSQEGATFRIHARKFGKFIRDAVKYPPPDSTPRYGLLKSDLAFMEGDDRLPGLALSKLAEPENAIIVPADDGTRARAGVGFIYEFSPGEDITGKDTVPLAEVKPPKYAIRYVGDVTKMMGSIKNDGQLVPIIVRPCKEPGFRYEIVDGFTRFRSIDCLGYIARVRVEVQELTDAEAVRKALALNMVRYQMNDLEQAKTFSLMITNGWATTESLASLIGYSKDYVRDRLALMEAPPEIQEKLAHREVSLDRALYYSKVVRQEKVEREKVVELIDKSNELGLSAKQTESTLQVVMTEHASVDEATTKVLEKDNRELIRKERRTLIATRQTREFTCEHGTHYQVDWDRAEIYVQTKIPDYGADF